jgi:hypothetical protein
MRFRHVRLNSASPTRSLGRGRGIAAGSRIAAPMPFPGLQAALLRRGRDRGNPYRRVGIPALWQRRISVVGNKIDRLKVATGVVLILGPTIAAAADECIRPGEIVCRPGAPHPVHGNETPPDGPLAEFGPTALGTGTGTDTATGTLPPPRRMDYWLRAVGEQSRNWDNTVQEILQRRRNFLVVDSSPAMVATGTQTGKSSWD